MTRLNGVRLDDEERKILYDAMKIIRRMHKVTSDPVLENMVNALEPLNSCLQNGSLWTYEYDNSGGVCR